MWCLIDLYGNCTAIEFVDMRRSLNNFARAAPGEHPSGARPASATTSADDEDLSISRDGGDGDPEEIVSNSLNSLALNEPPMPLRFNSNTSFRPVSFHPATGPNISLNGSSTMAWRHDDEYSNGYVFTASPIR